MKLTANAKREIEVWYDIDLAEDEVWELVKAADLEVDSLADLGKYELEQIWNEILGSTDYDFNEDVADADEYLWDWGIEDE